MCASYGLQPQVQEILEEFDVLDDRLSADALATWMDEFAKAGISAFPTGNNALNLNPIVRERGGKRELELAWWTLWVRGQKPQYPSFNARDDKLLTSWAGPMKSRRALVPVSEWYEKGKKFHRGGKPFALAAIYNEADTPAGHVPTYSIATMEPSAQRFAAIHNRQPIVVPETLYGDWLDPRTLGDAELLGVMLAAARDYSAEIEISDGSPVRAPRVTKKANGDALI
jgi:putative SOS response-associated peptidase YedK